MDATNSKYDSITNGKQNNTHILSWACFVNAFYSQFDYCVFLVTQHLFCIHLLCLIASFVEALFSPSISMFLLS